MLWAYHWSPRELDPVSSGHAACCRRLGSPPTCFSSPSNYTSGFPLYMVLHDLGICSTSQTQSR